jgi:hypothetical protein
VPRDGDHQWFAAKRGDELRGVLLVMPLVKSGGAASSVSVSVFVPPQQQHGEAVVRALLDRVELTTTGAAGSGGLCGEVRFAGLDKAWLPLVRERAAAAGAQESWFNPCLALHCPEARFVRPAQSDSAAHLRAQSLRLDSIAAGTTLRPIASCTAPVHSAPSLLTALS